MSSLLGYLLPHTKLGPGFSAIWANLNFIMQWQYQIKGEHHGHGTVHQGALKNWDCSSEKAKGAVIFVSSAPVLMVLKDQTLRHRNGGHPGFPGHGHKQSKQGWLSFAAPAASCPICPVGRDLQETFGNFSAAVSRQTWVGNPKLFGFSCPEATRPSRKVSPAPRQDSRWVLYKDKCFMNSSFPVLMVDLIWTLRFTVCGSKESGLSFYCPAAQSVKLVQAE